MSRWLCDVYKRQDTYTAYTETTEGGGGEGGSPPPTITLTSPTSGTQYMDDQNSNWSQPLDAGTEYILSVTSTTDVTVFMKAENNPEVSVTLTSDGSVATGSFTPTHTDTYTAYTETTKERGEAVLRHLQLL